MESTAHLIKKLYPHHADQIVQELKDYLQSFDVERNPYPNHSWYKYVNLYVMYPDTFRNHNASPIRNLIPHLRRIKRLGCNAVHVLPFLKSPMVDKGFDVSDYYEVREKLGTIEDVKLFIEEARKLGLRVFMDLIFNHVSEEHEWFKRAEAGDGHYRNYFIHQKKKPNFKRKIHKDSAVWAEYVVNGRKKLINVAFPEYSGEIPHWRQGKDGYWYYHTYYPQQLDVNWKNPYVFIEYAKILIYWTSLGFNSRLDAIPFVGKSAYKEADNNTPFTKNLLTLLGSLAELINPENVFIVETYEKEDTIIDYFGDSNTRQAKLAYNFHLCTYLWVSLVTKDTSYVWDKLETLAYIPAHAEWVNFLRNHDELSLAYLEGDLLKEVSEVLMHRGRVFREGYGISGRTYSLLKRNEKRFLNAYLLAASMPGGMQILYGDEIGKTNIPFHKLSKAEKHDSRNINRGNLTKKEYNSAKAKRIFKRIREFIKIREVLREYLNIWPIKLAAPRQVFAAIYQTGSSQLIILINLSRKSQEIVISTLDYTPVLKLHNVKIEDNRVILGSYAGLWLQK